MRDNDVAPAVFFFWVPPSHPFERGTNLNTALEGDGIYMQVVSAGAANAPLAVMLSVTQGSSHLDLDSAGAFGYQNLGNGKLEVTIDTGQFTQGLFIPLMDNDTIGVDGSVNITLDEDPDRNYTPVSSANMATIPVKDNDAASTVTISGGEDAVTEGGRVSYTVTRTWAFRRKPKAAGRKRTIGADR